MIISGPWTVKKILLTSVGVLILLLLARYIYKEIKFHFQREYAAEVCEEKGGYWNDGPIAVPGYLRSLSTFEDYAKFLLVDGYSFMESHRVVFGRNFLTTTNNNKIYSRFTVNDRNSSLCDGFNKYWDRLNDEKRAKYMGMGLKEDQCIGIDTFEDKGLLWSEYTIERTAEDDNKVPAIKWVKDQVVNFKTGDVVAQITSFGGCLDGMLRVEPFYNGCYGGGSYVVSCTFDDGGAIRERTLMPVK